MSGAIPAEIGLMDGRDNTASKREGSVKHEISQGWLPSRSKLEFEGLKHRLAAWVQRRRWFIIFVLAPTLVVALYYCLVASDIYVSESRFVVKSPNQRSSQVSTLANLIQTTGLTGGQEQSNEVVDYIRSRSALNDVGHQFDLQAAYSRSSVDSFSRFPGWFKGDGRENLYKYYGKMVDVGPDHDTNVVVLITRAFSPDDAYRLNQQLLGLGEKLVNELNERARGRAIAEAQRNVGEAEARVRKTRIELSSFRDAERVVDPGKQAGGVIEISNRMVTQRAALAAQLELMERVAPKNPAISSVRSQIAALDREIAGQYGQAVGSNGSLARKMGPYEGLLVEQEFASQMLTAAYASLEQARAESFKQQFYLERVAEPSKPDRPALPRRLISVLTVFGSLVCLYFIAWMFIVGILEHAPEN